jgi:hypothetical protein
MMTLYPPLNLKLNISFVKKLKNYLRVMKNYPELFTDLRGERVKHVLDLGHLLASPIRDQNGSRVFIINARKFHQECLRFNYES